MGELTLIYTKMGGVPNEEGAPSGRSGEPSVGEWAATSQHIKQVSNQRIGGRRARHLSSMWAATSRVHHLSKRGAPPKQHMLKTNHQLINQLSFKSSLSPLTLTLTFVPLFVFNNVPTCSFIFALADFY
jgi:hypothetical protein